MVLLLFTSVAVFLQRVAISCELQAWLHFETLGGINPPSVVHLNSLSSHLSGSRISRVLQRSLSCKRYCIPWPGRINGPYSFSWVSSQFDVLGRTPKKQGSLEYTPIKMPQTFLLAPAMFQCSHSFGDTAPNCFPRRAKRGWSSFSLFDGTNLSPLLRERFFLANTSTESLV